MRTLIAMLASTALITPFTALAADAAMDADIVVIGKSYGQPVGKTVTPLKDVPNTITVIDRGQIEAQNLFTLEDALTATPGITVNGVGSEDPSFLSRGFAINNYMIDGVPTLSLGFPGVVPDLFAYDRLEVLRGPAGLFSGSGNPAGSINLVRKRPLDTLQLRAAAGYGSFDNIRGEIDLSVPVTANAAVRVGAMVQDQDQFFDVAHRNRITAFGVGSVALGERTTLTFGANYDRFKPAIQSGLPGIIGGADGSDGQLLDIRRSTFLGADWNRFQSDTVSAFVEVAHRVSDRWTLRASGLYTDVDRIDIYSYIGNQPITPTNGVTSQIAYRGDTYMTTKSFDFNGVGSFPAFGREQTLILGVDYQGNSQRQNATRLSNFARIDVYNPVSPAEPPLDPFGPLPPFQGPGGPVTQVYGGTTSDVEQFGLYGQLRVSPVAGLTLVGGGRVTWWDTNNQTVLPTLLPPTGYAINNRFTPYAGLVWDVTDTLNVYASYADSFTPQTSALPRVGGGAIAPLIGAQYEAGTKLSLFNDRLLLSAAAYQITQSNRLFTDPDLPGVVQQIGKVRARGVEAEAAGEILPGWRINGGYAYIQNKYLEDSNPLLEGISFVPVIPSHSIKAFTNYAPAEGALAGASLGGGVTWFSPTAGGNAAVFNADGSLRTRSTIVRQGSYAVFDLRAGYKVSEQIALSVNVNNVFDRTYFARISSTGRGNYFGSPRTVFATVRFTYK
ncbi:TonB-dependent siderophore receptor [Polymorphobacter fuscus]|uniref:TonB-dependent siderophore receptor n=1 Tax=Sandarakinorhabdus fusca TaxID=1439888 RepID=A0A7C9KY09_9SPHN|nr:TonB-dependent siderophore receptor [Polymorphobacter fuscus]KAB7648808.1 TonB-dependent siderophore receptor [Polymorphobacter fuscus]MQT16388.1 TonB-dependent siderophore receptor [Polymorphobacter fuscus]NJC07323.1 outer membrane receptor for ferric coprogen and ferric-rhodotorulic acid [Polymorphobacter fuscus]